MEETKYKTEKVKDFAELRDFNGCGGDLGYTNGGKEVICDSNTSWFCEREIHKKLNKINKEV